MAQMGLEECVEDCKLCMYMAVCVCVAMNYVCEYGCFYVWIQIDLHVCAFLVVVVVDDDDVCVV